MMYLSKLTLRPDRFSRDLTANPYRIHQIVAGACSNDPRTLFRIEMSGPAPTILVQSHAYPDWNTSFTSRDLFCLHSTDIRPLHLDFKAGSSYFFRLLANPTKQNKEIGRRAILGEDSQKEWLGWKLGEAGAQVEEAQVIACWDQRSYRGYPKRDSEHMNHHVVLFEGVLQVTDPDLFAKAVEAGFGRAKGLGCGLLSVAPMERP